jgi:uncharacterized damage-inducible protein DinB
MPMDAPIVAVTADDYMYFVRRAVDGMLDIVREVGDDAIRRPALPGANTAYGLLTHCLGVVEYWGGRVVAGRPIERDRAAEFDAVGTVDEIAGRCADVLARLERDVAAAEPFADLRNEPDVWALGPTIALRQGSALFHLYEELAQHHGQMQVLRDALAVGR